MRKAMALAIAVIAAFLFITGESFAGEVDILVQKLVEKNILTPVEAQIILDETKHEVAKELAKGESYALPKWAQKINLTGDLRLRYQYNTQEDANDRHRARYRYRLGIGADIVDSVKVAAGIASGGDDPRSTNETLDDQFETKGAMLDYAYASWHPADWFTLLGGKIKGNPIWLTSDLLWDGDINPEGAAMRMYMEDVLPHVDAFGNAALFILDESAGDDKDPFMVVSQAGLNWKMTDKAHLKAAVASYNPINEQKSAFEWSAGTNTLRNGVLINEYDALVASAEIGVNNPIEQLDFINYCALFGDYVIAPDPTDDNQGFLVGLSVGDKKVSKKGEWAAKALYRYLEQDAWLDFLPDSDAYDGGTNIHGPELVFEYGLSDNVILGLDWYYCDLINGADVPQSLIQADMLFKF